MAPDGGEDEGVLTVPVSRRADAKPATVGEVVAEQRKCGERERYRDVEVEATSTHKLIANRYGLSR